jgi:hypothetical protein
MNGSRISATLGAALACFALNAIAQGTTTTDPKKTPKADETKDQSKALPSKTAEPKSTRRNRTEESAGQSATGKSGREGHRHAAASTVQYEAGKAPDLKD